MATSFSRPKQEQGSGDPSERSFSDTESSIGYNSSSMEYFDKDSGQSVHCGLNHHGHTAAECRDLQLRIAQEAAAEAPQAAAAVPQAVAAEKKAEKSNGNMASLASSESGFVSGDQEKQKVDVCYGGEQIYWRKFKCNTTVGKLLDDLRPKVARKVQTSYRLINTATGIDLLTISSHLLKDVQQIDGIIKVEVVTNSST